MATIKAKHYGVDEARLAEDPIVVAMAAEIPRDGFRGRYLHDNGQPTFQFMMLANGEYRKRGGTDGAHIGCIAHAILNIKGIG